MGSCPSAARVRLCGAGTVPRLDNDRDVARTGRTECTAGECVRWTEHMTFFEITDDEI